MSRDAIEAQRDKSTLIYREATAPGLLLEMKLLRIIESTQSEYQKIDVLETYFGKTLVTDGKTQSSQFDEAAYHESLVHPALLKAGFRHGGPNTVFIGGGGELATAREVLRYKSVEKVVMVDLDQAVIDVCKKHLPEWGGEGVATDPRLELVVGDAYKYLRETDRKFDAIIMDISDPIEAGPGIALYTQEFYTHALSLLYPHGVFVTQAGMAEAFPTAVVKGMSEDPTCFAPIHNTLRSVFDCVLPYTCNIASFASDWGFVMAFNLTGADKEGLGADALAAPVVEEEWKSHLSVVDELIEEKIDGGSNVLKFYDGTTHRRSFYLTKPLRRLLDSDDRIMTRDNPIFMY